MVWFIWRGIRVPPLTQPLLTALSELQLFGFIFFFFCYLLWTSCYMTVLPCASAGGNEVEVASLPKFISCVTGFAL